MKTMMRDMMDRKDNINAFDEKTIWNQWIIFSNVNESIKREKYTYIKN